MEARRARAMSEMRAGKCEATSTSDFILRAKVLLSSFIRCRARPKTFLDLQPATLLPSRSHAQCVRMYLILLGALRDAT